MRQLRDGIESYPAQSRRRFVALGGSASKNPLHCQEIMSRPLEKAQLSELLCLEALHVDLTQKLRQLTVGANLDHEISK
jgi:hypothetical protein